MAILSEEPVLDLATARARVDIADLLDLQLAPLGLKAIDALALQPGETVVDIGCGAGNTTLQLAERVGPDGRVIGVEIAPLLLEAARRRADGLAQVNFRDADAESLDLPTDGADAVFSRFGVTDFRDPVAAFANFRRLLKPGGRLAFVCWRPFVANELDLAPLYASGLRDLGDAAPYPYADPAFNRALLQAAGFSAVEVQGHDELVSSGDAQAMTRVASTVGTLGKILRDNPGLRAEAEPKVKAAFERRQAEGRVALRAAIWLVTARA